MKTVLKNSRIIFFSTCLLLTASCGNDSDDSAPLLQEQQADEGVYGVELQPVNSSLTIMQGESNIKIDEDRLEIYLASREGPAVTEHRQFIYSGNKCPNSGDDQNKDGLIDGNELIAVTGPAIIPLDNDLSSQERGQVFPVSDQVGSYIYRQQTSLQDLVEDLRLPDTNEEDDLIRLRPDSRLNLSGKVLVIHGVADNTQLESSVSARGNLSPQQSLPVACGIIERNRVFPEQEETPSTTQEAPFREFSQRLSSDLAIYGERCTEGENFEIQTRNGLRNMSCGKNQWVIFIDNINSCDPQGSCTEIGVFPIFAKLVRADVISASTISFWDIIPVTRIHSPLSDLLKDYWVKFDLNGPTEVLKK